MSQDDKQLVIDLEKESHVGPPDALSIDPAAERRLVWKLDFTVLPILFLLFMMCFLDRINISNAKIQGMTADLNLTGNRFNIALLVRLAPPKSDNVLSTHCQADSCTGLLHLLHPF